uniref:SUN domain-containing protein n=1 Tax=Onchocerca volvulus TaxID=6282 RepID=A0A8R1XVJ7_ONCVO
MGIFGREPTIGNSNLTQSDLDRLLDLDDTYRTDYTYVTSKSYRLNGSDDYVNPRMSRLPLSYYRRKWAFERAREVGLLYYIYFCTCDFVNELIPKPLAMILNVIINILWFIIHCLWYVINGIFPNPEHLKDMQRVQLEPIVDLQEYKYSIKKREKQNKQESDFPPSSTPIRETAWHSQSPSSSDSLAKKLGRSFAKMITLDYFFRNGIQRKITPKERNLDHSDDYDEHKWQEYSSFIPAHDLANNIKRRVKTSSYEYSEDRGPEVGNQSVRTMKLSKGLVESLFFKLFYLTFMALLSPIKTFEFTIGKITRILLGSRFVCVQIAIFSLFFDCIFKMHLFLKYKCISERLNSYDLRSRSVRKTLSFEETLSYTDRFANFLSETATSCFLSVFSRIIKVFFLPFTIFSYIIGRFLSSNRSKHSLQQAVRASARHEPYSLLQIFRFLIDLFCSCVTGLIFFLVSVQSIPFYIAENIRERAAYILANMFGSKAALLVSYEEVKSVKRKGFTTDLNSLAATDQQKMIHTVVCNKRQLLPTRRSLKYSSIFWKWLFPLLVLLLLIMFYKRHDDQDDPRVDVTKGFDGIRQNFFDRWKQKIEYGLNFVLRNALYLLSSVFHFLCDLLLYPGKLYGAMMYPREAVEQMVQLPKYVYMAGQSKGTKANACSYNFLCRIPSGLYSFGKSIVIRFFESVSILGSSVYGVIQQLSAVSEWFQIDRISENIVNIVLFVWKLINSVLQIVLASPSYFISIISQFVPFRNQKTENVISSNDFNQQQVEWTLEHLRHEKESLEFKVLQLRRERELEENRYKDIHEALQLVEKSSSSMSTNKQLHESSLVNDEFSQHKNDFLNYMANLRKEEDEELEMRLLAIEKRLMEQLDIVSQKIENEIAQKMIHASQDVKRLILSNELSELSSAVGNLRIQFDKLRREKEAKIAQFARSVISHDIKRSDDLDTLKTELSQKIKDDLDKEISFSLNRFEKASHEEREEFRLEIMKMVENRVLALFASHIAEENATVSETKLSSVLGLSESDFTMIKKMITDALDMYDADKTGKVDYALESSGASIVSTRCTEPYKENSRLESIFGIPLWYLSYSPRAVIQHRPLAAGECWAFRGKGYLTIKLSHPIYVTEVSYEHLHSTLHPDGVLRSAPKLFQIYSYKAVDDLKSKSLLGQYEYDIKGRALQTFHVQSDFNTPVSIVELVVQSNWDSDYTCLYRFRVHGRKA